MISLTVFCCKCWLVGARVADGAKLAHLGDLVPVALAAPVKSIDVAPNPHRMVQMARTVWPRGTDVYIVKVLLHAGWAQHTKIALG